MAATESANSIVNIMLGWLKGLANWVLRLFNLAGGSSPLQWLSDNWLHLLVILLIVGTALDLLVWLFRWRPYWVWFRKKRVVIHDENFFAMEKVGGMDAVDDEDLFSAEWNSAPRKKRSTTVPKRANGKAPAVKKAAPASRKGSGSGKKPAKGPQDSLDALFDAPERPRKNHAGKRP